MLLITWRGLRSSHLCNTMQQLTMLLVTPVFDKSTFLSNFNWDGIKGPFIWSLNRILGVTAATEQYRNIWGINTFEYSSKVYKCNHYTCSRIGKQCGAIVEVCAVECAECANVSDHYIYFTTLYSNIWDDEYLYSKSLYCSVRMWRRDDSFRVQSQEVNMRCSIIRKPATVESTCFASAELKAGPRHQLITWLLRAPQPPGGP